MDVSGYKSDDEFYGALQAREEQWSQMQQLAGHGQEYMRHAGDFQKWRTEQAKVAAEQAQQAAAKKKSGFEWNLPKLDRSLLDYVERDPQSGRYVPRVSPNGFVQINPAAADEVNRYHDARTQHADRLLNEFPDLSWQAVEDKVEKLVADRIKEVFSQRESKQTAEGFVQEHFDKLYQVDPQNGRPVVNPATGEYAMTPQGLMFDKYVNEARDLGIVDSSKIINYATKMSDAETVTAWGQQQQAAISESKTQGPALVQNPVETRQMFLERALNSPNRSGSAQPAINGSGVQNPGLKFSQIGAEELARLGNNVSMQ